MNGATFFFLAIGVVILIVLVKAANEPPPPTRAERIIRGIAGALEVILTVAEIVLSQIEAWFEQNRRQDTIGRLVRENLASGDVKVVANILDRGGVTLQQQAWQSRSLSQDLRNKFGNSNSITVY